MSDASDAVGDFELDAALVATLRACDRARPIRFHIPSFKRYASDELPGCGGAKWPAISVTGAACQLNCDHCRAKILEPMLPATTPEDLWRVVQSQIAAGARGMLLSGGSNHRNQVPYAPFYPIIRRIKHADPGFQIALHTALVERDDAQHMQDAGVDIAMLDVIGAQDTITQVYHLKRRVEDFERALAHLVATRMRVVPHIVLGLHYGHFLGEWRALEIIRRHRPSALVLVAAMPIYASVQRPFATPDAHAVGSFFGEARRALGDLPILLGCARPPGRAKSQIDAYAVLAGLDGVAHPADGVVRLATDLGRRIEISPACCSVALGEMVQASVASPHGAASIRAAGALAGIPVTVA